MKAIRIEQFGGPEVMALQEVPDLQPGPGQVLVQVKAAGVNPVDAYIRTGTYAMKPPLPYTPGADGAGLVQSVGKEVTKIKPGDRVYVINALSGTYAEQTLALERSVFNLPENVSFAQGAAIGVPYGTAHRALFHRGLAQRGETVLIHGASGGVGTAAIQLAKKAGLIVIGTGGTDKGRQLVLDLGADQVLNHHDPEFGEKLLKLTKGQGVNLIIEMLANVNLAKDLSYLSKFGRVVVVGSRGPIEVNFRDAMGRDADIRAMTLFNASAEDLAGIHADLGKGLKEGSLTPIVGREILLKEASRAHLEIMKSESFGKMVLFP